MTYDWRNMNEYEWGTVLMPFCVQRNNLISLLLLCFYFTLAKKEMQKALRKTSFSSGCLKFSS